jgi:hypothetical protein
VAILAAHAIHAFVIAGVLFSGAASSWPSGVIMMVVSTGVMRCSVVRMDAIALVMTSNRCVRAAPAPALLHVISCAEIIGMKNVSILSAGQRLDYVKILANAVFLQSNIVHTIVTKVLSEQNRRFALVRIDGPVDWMRYAAK